MPRPGADDPRRAVRRRPHRGRRSRPPLFRSRPQPTRRSARPAFAGLSQLSGPATGIGAAGSVDRGGVPTISARRPTSRSSTRTDRHRVGLGRAIDVLRAAPAGSRTPIPGSTTTAPWPLDRDRGQLDLQGGRRPAVRLRRLDDLGHRRPARRLHAVVLGIPEFLARLHRARIVVRQARLGRERLRDAEGFPSNCMDQPGADYAGADILVFDWADLLGNGGPNQAVDTTSCSRRSVLHAADRLPDPGLEPGPGRR